jgi:hypothetical protein
MTLKANLLYFTIVFCILFIPLGCGQRNFDSNHSVMQQLRENGKIKTFPLIIVISHPLTGSEIPVDIKELCLLSRQQCKTLPIAGFLRLGSTYSTYSCVPNLQLSPSSEKKEASITQLVEQQVSAYIAKTTLKEYTSLAAPAEKGTDVKSLVENYLTSTSDSVFFYMPIGSASTAIAVGQRSYPVYDNISELRQKIDELVCNGNPSISVFYNSYLSNSAPTFVREAPKRGTIAGDTCIQNSKYQKVSDGHGGFMAGKLIELNSSACGYTFPVGVAGDTCVNGSKYQRIHNGKGGFSIGRLIEKNSRDCGASFPTAGTPAGGFICFQQSKYERLHDGKGGYIRGKLIEVNSIDCGAKPAIKSAGVPKNTRTDKNTAANKKEASPLLKSKITAVKDNRCVRKSDPICEQDKGGNYTGRRVQYCYDKNDRVIQTIVVSKCDSDCRCIGD